MSTDAATCAIKNYDAGCKAVMKRGAPHELCDIALHHEQVHAEDCKNRPASIDPGELSYSRDSEQRAYRRTLDDLDKYLQDHHCS